MTLHPLARLTLVRTPRWTVALVLAQVTLILWQATSSATYLPVARFMKETYVTLVHEFLMIVVGYVVPAFAKYLGNHPPTIKQAAHAISFTLLFPAFYFLLGYAERVVFPATETKSFDERLKGMPAWLCALLGSHVIVTIWQLTSTSYLAVAQLVESIYLEHVQQLVEWVAHQWFPAIEDIVKSHPLDTESAVHFVSGVVVFPLLLGALWWWRGDLSARRVLQPTPAVPAPLRRRVAPPPLGPTSLKERLDQAAKGKGRSDA